MQQEPERVGQQGSCDHQCGRHAGGGVPGTVPQGRGSPPRGPRDEDDRGDHGSERRDEQHLRAEEELDGEEDPEGGTRHRGPPPLRAEEVLEHQDEDRGDGQEGDVQLAEGELGDHERREPVEQAADEGGGRPAHPAPQDRPHGQGRQCRGEGQADVRGRGRDPPGAVTGASGTDRASTLVSSSRLMPVGWNSHADQKRPWPWAMANGGHPKNQMNRAASPHPHVVVADGWEVHTPHQRPSASRGRWRRRRRSTGPRSPGPARPASGRRIAPSRTTRDGRPVPDRPLGAVRHDGRPSVSAGPSASPQPPRAASGPRRAGSPPRSGRR